MTRIHIRHSLPFVFHGQRIEYALGVAPIEWTTGPCVDPTVFRVAYSCSDEDPRVCDVSREDIERLLEGSETHPGASKTVELGAHIDQWDPYIDPFTLNPRTAVPLLEDWPRDTYIINRDSDISRWERFTTNVSGLFDSWFGAGKYRFNRVSAIDGASSSFVHTWPWNRYIGNRHLSGTMHENLKTLALTLSHFKTLDTILVQKGAESTEWVMVMEDDASLENIGRWPTGFGEMIRELPDHVGLCSIGRLFPIGEEKYSPFLTFEPLRYYGTTIAYMIRPCAIPAMLERVFTAHPVPSLGVSDFEVYRSCAMTTWMTRFPWITFHDDTESTIHTEHHSYQSRCKRDFLEKYVIQDRTGCKVEGEVSKNEILIQKTIIKC